MRNRTTLAFTLLATTTLLAGCGSQSLSSSTETTALAGPDLAGVTFEDQTGRTAVQVDAVDNTFKAEYLEVSAGTAVTFRNDGRNDHNVIPTTTDGFAAIQADQFEPGTEQTVTFAEPGDYPYYCSLHGTKTKGMIGAIRVT
jgi:plastocyanin